MAWYRAVVLAHRSHVFFLIATFSFSLFWFSIPLATRPNRFLLVYRVFWSDIQPIIRFSFFMILIVALTIPVVRPCLWNYQHSTKFYAARWDPASRPGLRRWTEVVHSKRSIELAVYKKGSVSSGWFQKIPSKGFKRCFTIS